MEWWKNKVKYDGPDVENVLKREYGSWHQWSCIYPKLDSTRNILINVSLFSGMVVMFAYTILAFFTTSALSMSDVASMSESLHIGVLAFVVLVSLTQCWLKRSNISIVHRELNKTIVYQGIEEDIASIWKNSISRKRKVARFWIACSFLNFAFLLFISPWMNSLFKRKGPDNDLLNHTLLLICWTPFEMSSGITHVLAQIWLVSCISSGTIVLTTIFLFYTCVSESFCCQLKIFKVSLEKIEDRVSQFFKPGGNEILESERAKVYGQCLEESIRHHVMIHKIFVVFKDLASYSLLVTLVCGSTMIACDAIVFVTANGRVATMLNCCTFCAAELFAIGVTCYFGDKICELSLEVRNEMYNCRWYTLSKSTTRSVLIFMEVSKTPFTITGGGIVPATMPTFSNILNGAYSYFSLLRTIFQ